MNQQDSGAILVGGGVPSSLCPLGPPLFSPLNYGSRLNAQGWGLWALTTGKGFNADNTINDGVNNEYSYVEGTSGASAIVGGAVASLLGVAKAHGIKLTPSQVREITGTTGIPQGLEPGETKVCTTEDSKSGKCK